MNVQTNFYQKWVRIALLNFVVLAAVGVLLRYKILFPIPFVEQKHLLHAHSHFAFSGWVSLALYISVIYILQPTQQLQKKFELLLAAQLMSSYGMLFTFSFTGYATGSIAFSTFSIFISYAFAWLAVQQLMTKKTIEKKWLITGLLCNVISSSGTFVLAYLMVTKNLRQDLYFGSVYFFLHFQYNGWFLFVIGGLFLAYIAKWLQPADVSNANRFYILLLTALIPAWFLSLMWMRIPAWMYYAGVAGSIMQLAALLFLIKLLLAVRKTLLISINPLAKWFWLIAGSAFVLKIIMQTFSAIPQLNTYAFGIRAIVIGFLHLVLLVFVSIFLVGHFIHEQLIAVQKPIAKKAAWLFTAGVLLNEFILMLQGLAAIQYETIPYAGYLLLFTAILIFTGLLLLLSTGTKENSERLLH